MRAELREASSRSSFCGLRAPLPIQTAINLSEECQEGKRGQHGLFESSECRMSGGHSWRPACHSTHFRSPVALRLAVCKPKQ